MNLFTLSAELTIDKDKYEKGLNESKKSAESAGTKIEKSLDKAQKKTKSYSDTVKNTSKTTEELGNTTEKSFDKSKKSVQKTNDEIDNTKKKAKQAGQETQQQTNNTNQKLTQTQKILKGIKDSASSVASGISSVGSKLVSAFKVASVAGTAAIVAMGKVGFDYNKQMETYTTNFETMLGSVDAATNLVKRLNETAAKTPFELSDLASATQTLLAFNVSGDESTDVLTKLGDISLGNADKLGSLTRAYGKMNAAQKVTLEDINMMIDAGYNPLLNISERTGESMQDLYDRISDGKVSFEEIKQAIADATAEGGQFYQGMEKASQTTEGLLSTLSDNVRMKMGEMFQGVSDGVKMVLPKLIEMVDGFDASGFADKVNQVIAAFTDAKSIGDVLTNLISIGQQWGSEFGATIQNVAPQIVTALSGAFQQVFPVIAELAPQMMESMVGGIETALPLLADAAYNMLTSFGGYVQENLPTLLETGLQMLTGLSESIRENAGIIVDGAINLAISFAQGLANSIPTIVQYVPTIISNIAGVINDNAPKILAAAVQIAWTLITGLIQSIPTIVANIPQIINAIVDVLTAFNWLNIGSTIIEALSNGVKGAVGFAKTAAKNVAEGLKNAILNLPSEMMSFGRNVISFFSSGISGMAGTAGSAIKAVASAIKNGITGLPSEVLSIGKNIVTGLWNGINGKVSWIKDKILGFAGGIVSSVKSALGIKSPSRVMRDQVGKYIPMGLSKGIEENAGYVKDAMAGLDSIVTTPIDAPKVNGGSSSGFTYGGAITINVYASEGQDAKEIAQEVSEILAKQTQRKKAVYGY